MTRDALWRLAYTLICYLATPLVLLRLARRGLHAPAYWRRWPERFGYGPTLRGRRSLWLHAVSVGEAQAAAPLLRRLRERFPHIPVVVTTTTPTGSQRVRELFGDDVHHSYAPYDLPGAVQRFLRRSRPGLSVIMETELWPNLFRGLRLRGIPLIVANGRISARSARGYRRVRTLATNTLRCASFVAAQSRSDAQRFIELGALPERVGVVGNVKFDLHPAASLIEQAEALRGEWGRNRSVWLAASTHEGEEECVLDAHSAVQAQHPGCLLVLVPRHPERFARIASLCRSRGLRTALRSQREVVSADTEVYLGDTMGELVLLYAAADIAFVGGSLVPVGGHNPLEPATLGLPLLFGPHMYHSEEASRQLLENGAARTVHNSREMTGVLLELLADPQRRTIAGEHAREVVEQNRGAVEQLVAIAARYLED